MFYKRLVIFVYSNLEKGFGKAHIALGYAVLFNWVLKINIYSPEPGGI